MTNTITLTGAQWTELKAVIRQHIDVMAEYAPDGDALSFVHALEDDMNSFLLEIDDANTRARYMALAADDQLPLFAGALE